MNFFAIFLRVKSGKKGIFVGIGVANRSISSATPRDTENATARKAIFLGHSWKLDVFAFFRCAAQKRDKKIHCVCSNGIMSCLVLDKCGNPRKFFIQH